jgi:hypothetical protein
MALDLAALLANPPPLHERGGHLISDWRIDDDTARQLYARIAPGMKTVETGAGLSTVIFAASGCDHTCVIPDAPLAERIKNYCRSAAIDCSNVRFTIAESCDVIHELEPAAYDLALIDGCRGFPSIFVDFCYAAKALKLGGILFLDDMHIFTCKLTADFMGQDAGWKILYGTDRFVVGQKASDTIDLEWVYQPFVAVRSAYYAPTAPVGITTKLTQHLRDHGVAATVRKVVARV